MRLPERAAFRRREQSVPVFAEGVQKVIFGIAAGRAIGLRHARRQGAVEEAIVPSVDPQGRDLRRAPERRRCIDQAVRRTILVRLASGITAATAGEIDDSSYARWTPARRGQRTPAAGRLAHQQDVVSPDRIEAREIAGDVLDVVRCRQPAADVVGLAAGAIGLGPDAAARTVATAQRQHDHVAAGQQPVRARPIFGRRHRLARGSVCRRAVADDRKRERTGPRWNEDARRQQDVDTLRVLAHGNEPGLFAGALGVGGETPWPRIFDDLPGIGGRCLRRWNQTQRQHRGGSGIFQRNDPISSGGDARCEERHIRIPPLLIFFKEVV